MMKRVICGSVTDSSDPVRAASCHRSSNEPGLAHRFPHRTVPKSAPLRPFACATIRSTSALVSPYTLVGIQAWEELIATKRSNAESPRAASMTAPVPCTFVSIASVGFASQSSMDFIAAR